MHAAAEVLARFPVTLSVRDRPWQRALLGTALVLHGFAHAGAGVWAVNGGPLWLITVLWCGSMTGYMAAGFGILRAPVLRRRWKPILLAATLASLVLLSFVGSLAVLVGAWLDLALMAVAFGPLQRRIDHAVAIAGASESLPTSVPKRRWLRWSAAGLLLAYTVSVSLFRPTYLRWGTTALERLTTLPGDELATGQYRADHGITIHAPADSIWPWLVQLGQDRGGFYSYAWLERLVGDDIHNADRIHPEWQRLERGDLVRAVQPTYLGGRFGDLGWRVAAIVPKRAIVLENWGTFALQPIDSSRSRLLIRTRGSGQPSLAGVLLSPLSVFVFEPAHFIMQRGMMRGVRDRGERMMRAPAQ